MDWFIAQSHLPSDLQFAIIFENAVSTPSTIPHAAQVPGLRIDIEHPKRPDCSFLYEKFDLLTASEIVIDWYVDRARAGDFSQVSHRELGHACMNTLMLCHEAPMAHCDLVSSLLTESIALQDGLSGVVALREFAAQSLMLMEHDSASALAH